MDLSTLARRFLPFLKPLLRETSGATVDGVGLSARAADPDAVTLDEAELWMETLVAQDTIATIVGRVDLPGQIEVR